MEDIKRFQNGSGFNKLWLHSFINDVMKFDLEILIVLDDFHVVNNPEIFAALSFLLQHMPKNLHFIISGRSVPNLKIAKMIVLGEILTLNQEELCFTVEESGMLLSKISKIELNSKERIKLWNIFEGWAAGIQMLALFLQNQENLTIPILKENQYIFDYLMEEVFHHLPSELKKFLLYTSILEQFSYEQCNHLLDRTDSLKILRKIKSLSLFLVCLDEQFLWFRYHNLFRDFLKRQLKETQPEMIPLLYEKTVLWYVKNQQFTEAVNWAIKGKDYKKALLLIEQISKEIGCNGESVMLHKWNKMLPKELVLESPRLILNSAWAMRAEGKEEKVIELIQLLQQFEPGPFWLKAEIVALSSSNVKLSDMEFEHIKEECEEVLEALPEEEFLSQMIYFNLGVLYLYRGDFENSYHHFKHCLEKSMETKNSYLIITSHKAVFTFLIHQGKYEQAEQMLLRCKEKMEGYRQDTLLITGLLYACLAELYYEWNEIDTAYEMAKKGKELGELENDAWTLAENASILAKIYQTTKEEEQQETAIAMAESCILESDLFDIKIKLLCYKTEKLLQKKADDSIAAKIEELEFLIGKDKILVYPNIMFLKVRYYMAKKEYSKAIAKMKPFLEDLTKKRQEGIMCEGYILLAIVYKKLGDNKTARDILEQAVKLAKKQKRITIFLNEGSIMKKMLEELENIVGVEEDTYKYIKLILEHFNKQEDKELKKLENVLSIREADILTLVKEGATNKEIAEKLFISNNTVKTHLLNIYTKLNVHNRTGAVTKAKEWKLI